MKGHVRRAYGDFRLRELRRLRFGFGGTFAPCFRASESPMATACVRLVTFRPLRPLLSVPRLRRRIAERTEREDVRDAFFPTDARLCRAEAVAIPGRPDGDGGEVYNRRAWM